MVFVETCVKSSCWEVLYKKRFLFLPGVYVIEIGWTVLDKRVILKRAFIFPKVVLWEIKSSSQKSRCLSVRNKVITSFLPRIFSHSIEYPDYLSVCSLRIRKIGKKFFHQILIWTVFKTLSLFPRKWFQLCQSKNCKNVKNVILKGSQHSFLT